MLPTSVATLEKHYHYWELFNRSGELVNFWIEVQNELVNVYRAELDPYYHHNGSCPVCVTDFIKRLYTHYDKQRKIPRKRNRSNGTNS